MLWDCYDKCLKVIKDSTTPKQKCEVLIDKRRLKVIKDSTTPKQKVELLLDNRRLKVIKDSTTPKLKQPSSQIGQV